MVAKLTWRPIGLKNFMVYHPTREIGAPYYGDRVVEEWIIDKYVIPYWTPKLLYTNMACQTNKGPHLMTELVVEHLNQLMSVYGMDLWFFQGDCEGYFANLSHERIMKNYEGMNPYGYFLMKNVIESYEEPLEYAQTLDPEHKHGCPKGNLPSQWTGVTCLNDYDHLAVKFPGCLGYFRFMDDFIAFFRRKEEARAFKNFTADYLVQEHIGVRLHPTKTKYSPIKNGFTFCGWRYEIRDCKIRLKVRDDRKALKKEEFKLKQELYKQGKITWKEIQDSMTSTFGHYGHGDTKKLIRYMSRKYWYSKGDEDVTKL